MFSLIASTAAASTNNNSVTSSGIDTTGAKLLCLVVGYFAAAGPTISDSNGNIWTGLTIQQVGINRAIRLYYCINPTVGSGHTFTASGINSFPCVLTSAWLATGAVSFDMQNGATNTGGAATSISTGSVTPSINGSLLITGVVHGTGPVNTPPTNFTLLNALGSSANSVGGSAAYEIQTTATTSNATWLTNTSNTLVAAIAVFREYLFDISVHTELNSFLLQESRYKILL